MRIGILETGEVAAELRDAWGDYPGMFVRMLRAVDPALDFLTIRVIAGDMPQTPLQADAWLVTGSRHGVYDDLPWIAPLRDFLRDCVAASVPVVGICFGHQLLAEAMGGTVVRSDRGWGLGVQDYEVEARPGWMAELPGHFAVRAVHQDQILTLPESAIVLARSPHCPYAALAYGDAEAPQAISVQAHPEFSRDFMAALIAARAGKAFSIEEAEAAQASLSREVHSEIVARMIADFLCNACARRAAA